MAERDENNNLRRVFVVFSRINLICGTHYTEPQAELECRVLDEKNYAEGPYRIVPYVPQEAQCRSTS